MSIARPKLQLVQGSASQTAMNTNRPQLYALSKPQPITPQQLALPGFTPAKRTIVSYGLNEQPLPVFRRVLQSHGIRFLADLRISPSFRGPDYGPDDIMRLLVSLGIKYRRFPQLSNGFIGESPNYRVVLDMYDRYLTTQQDALYNLHRMVDEGPLLLLGWEITHSPSERSVVIDALSRISADFELILANT